MGEIGINFKVDAQTDGIKRASQDFAAFQEKLSAIMGITDPEKAEEFWDEYNSGLNNAINIQDRLSMIAKRNGIAGGASGGGSGGGPGGGRDDNENEEENNSNKNRSIFQTYSRIGDSTVGSLHGASVDVMGTATKATTGLLDTAANALAKVNVAAAAAVKGLSLLLGASNELSKQYQEQIPSVMLTTTALRRFGDSAGEQSGKFRDTMMETSAMSAKYGYSLEQGLTTINQIARGGGKDAIKSTEEVMRMSSSLGFSAPISELVGLETFATRFGVEGAPQYVLGGAMDTVGSQRVQEQASAFQSMMADVIEQGADVAADKLSGTQNWLFRAFEERGAGTMGASAYSQLSGAVRGSTDLGSEVDILKYQAARREGDTIEDTMMHLEEGFNVEDFDRFKDSIRGSSDMEQSLLVQKAYGVNWTTARRLLDAPTAEAAKAEYEEIGPGSKIADTNESRITGLQEIIAQKLRVMGEVSFDAQVGIFEGAVSKMGGNETEAQKVERRMTAEELKMEFGETPFADVHVAAGKQERGVGGSGKPWIFKEEEERDWIRSGEKMRKFLQKEKYQQALVVATDAERKQALNLNGPEAGSRWGEQEAQAFIKLVEQLYQKYKLPDKDINASTKVYVRLPAGWRPSE